MTGVTGIEKRYDIRTVGDLMNVPLDRLGVCLHEIADVIAGLQRLEEHARRHGWMERVELLGLTWFDDGQDHVSVVFEGKEIVIR